MSSCDPRPSCCTSSTASSTVAYCREHKLCEMPSLTLTPAGRKGHRSCAIGWVGAILALGPEGLYESQGVVEVG